MGKIFKYTIVTLLTLWIVYCLIQFWQYRSYTALSRQFYNYFSKHCGQQSKCVVELHQITNFEWDHAYFFQKENQKNVKKITNIDIKFDPSYSDTDTQVIFIKDHKIVKSGYIISDFINKYQVKYNIFSPSKQIWVEFWHVAFTKPKTTNNEILYYDLQPSNDQLFVNYYIFQPSGPPYKAFVNARYTIYHTNMQQIHLQESK